MCRYRYVLLFHLDRSAVPMLQAGRCTSTGRPRRMSLDESDWGVTTGILGARNELYRLVIFLFIVGYLCMALAQWKIAVPNLRVQANRGLLEFYG